MIVAATLSSRSKAEALRARTESSNLKTWFVEKVPRIYYRSLECLATHGELSSSEIRDLAGIPDGSKQYQLLILDSWDLIEPVRRQYVGEYKTGIPATVYTLTEKGQALVEEW